MNLDTFKFEGIQFMKLLSSSFISAGVGTWRARGFHRVRVFSTGWVHDFDIRLFTVDAQ